MNLISFGFLPAEPYVSALCVCVSFVEWALFFIPLVFISVCPSVCVPHLFSGVVERKASSKSWAKSEPDINNWEGQEGREWLLQYSYVILTWLPASRPCTQYLWSLTDDWGCNAVSSLSLLLLLHLPFLPSVHFLIFHPHATSYFSTPSLSPSLALPSLLRSPCLCHFFSSPSHLLPSLRRVWHAQGPNSIIDQIKEMLLNSLNRQREHTHAPDTPKGLQHTHAHTEANTYSLCSLCSVQKQSTQIVDKLYFKIVSSSPAPSPSVTLPTELFNCCSLKPQTVCLSITPGPRCCL